MSLTDKTFIPFITLRFSYLKNKYFCAHTLLKGASDMKENSRNRSLLPSPKTKARSV